MKFRKFGRITLALAASLVIGFGTESCHYNYTEAYIIVTGSQYNQVGSYKENSDTGQLIASTAPVSSGGSNPVRAVLLTGGRYVYVLNQGKQAVDASGNITWTGANISLFSIGGQGGLSYQLSYPSQGLGSLRVMLGSGGNFLYVLDQYQPGTTPNVTAGSPTQSAAYPCYDAKSGVYRPAGDITAYSIDDSTGRLFLVQNLQQENGQGTPLSYFPLGCGPIDFHMGSSYLYTAETSDPSTGNSQVVYAYQASAGTGQLTQVPGGAQPITGASNISVIGGSQSGQWIYVLDAGNNVIDIFAPGSNGLLTAASIPSAPNNGNTTGMVALTTDSGSKYLYIANTVSSGLNQSSSSLSIFTVTPSSGALTPDASQQTYGTGSGPVCVFEDPSHQYVYTADSGSSTVVGAAFDPNTGTLVPLPRGSTFAVVGTPTWCLYSSNTD
ncbi:MAG TPA: beta-propeller fold lactonase family protein [Acidobacteriaceae bacterium]|jgi:6-phosphogluconolactonase (cycloisomerase 2 family)|nr:beta-propeller fold lactonase family protein [Acidobacteriaceae bacterium]